jgi:hypothetical protein
MSKFVRNDDSGKYEENVNRNLIRLTLKTSPYPCYQMHTSLVTRIHKTNENIHQTHHFYQVLSPFYLESSTIHLSVSVWAMVMNVPAYLFHSKRYLLCALVQQPKKLQKTKFNYIPLHFRLHPG